MIKILLFLTLIPVISFASENHKLTVVVTNFESEKGGHLIVAIHNTKSIFPSDWEKAFRKTNVEIDKNNSKTVVFEDLLVGKYAIIAIQDIDKDGKMSKNWIGFPREPFGTSNNPTFFGPPRYSKAEFELKSDQQLEVNLVSF